MQDISNTHHLRNNKPYKSTRAPSGPLRMTLRSKTKPQRDTYDGLCQSIARKTHCNARYDHETKQNSKRSVSVRGYAGFYNQKDRRSDAANTSLLDTIPVKRIRKWFR
eukprot:115594_1